MTGKRTQTDSTPGAFFALLLCVLSALSLNACRSTPLTPEPTTTEPKAKTPPSEGPAETAQPAAPGTPPKSAIARVLPESLIAAPAKDQTATRRLEYDTTVRTRAASGTWQYRTNRRGEIVGFEFSNHGGNPILPPRRDAVKNQLFTRDFQFRFDDRARQDIYLMISDWAPSRDRIFRLSEIVNRVLVFFPRRILPAIVDSGARHIVTLPTGEEVEFDGASHEIRAGAFLEAPVDLSADRQTRRFPGVEYRGSGVVVRADARGADPRIGTVAAVMPASGCAGGASCSQCEIPAKELWNQDGAARFKFSSDSDFERLLIARCGFSLPAIDSGIAIK
jgi:hypothetical protein